MSRPVVPCLLAVFFLACISIAAFGVLNPHIEPPQCDSCHKKIPTEEEAAAGHYFLLKDTIDDTCHICHEKTCCKPGSLHGINHPSNIKDWDRKYFRKPKTLPLHNGYITCNTCHLHRMPGGNQYKMVRIVKIDGKKIDWTDLCTDCHIGY
ncbi:MAG: hypothetical protein HZA60_06385 [Deltaproteobacteria bacterium]|nr:hypothetical protein [Deltaproteobacteria bacterium]